MEAKLQQTFSESLGVPFSSVNDELTYSNLPEWDSVGHMALIAAIEEAFDIMIDAEDVIDMSSVEKAIEILQKYDIQF